MVSRFGALALVLAMTMACATESEVTTHSLNASPRRLKPRPASKVTVFTTGAPSRPFVEVAMIEARQGTGSAEKDVFDDLRSQAGALGCDGLVLIGANDSVEGSVSTTGGIGVGRSMTPVQVSGTARTLHGYRATCIAWSDAEAEAEEKKAASAPPPDPRCNPPCEDGFKCWGGVCAASN